MDVQGTCVNLWHLSESISINQIYVAHNLGIWSKLVPLVFVFHFLGVHKHHSYVYRLQCSLAHVHRALEDDCRQRQNAWKFYLPLVDLSWTCLLVALSLFDTGSTFLKRKQTQFYRDLNLQCEMSSSGFFRPVWVIRKICKSRKSVSGISSPFQFFPCKTFREKNMLHITVKQ